MKTFVLTADKGGSCLRAEYTTYFDSQSCFIYYKLHDVCVGFVIHEETLGIDKAREQWDRHVEDGWEEIDK